MQPPDFTVPWTSMVDGSRSDFERLQTAYLDHARETLIPNLMAMLRLLQGPKLGYQVDRYDHSLQSASRAKRAGERPDLIVGALLHDLGDGFAPENHSEAGAAVLAPYVDEETNWVVRHHGLFQGYYYFHHLDGDRHARDVFADHRHFEACARFCAEYDQNCFDPDYDTLPVEDFIPDLIEVFSRPSSIPDVAPLEAGA